MIDDSVRRGEASIAWYMWMARYTRSKIELTRVVLEDGSHAAYLVCLQPSAVRGRASVLYAIGEDNASRIVYVLP